ncbi:MAG TPA: ABC transporter substrate-binding protein [Chthoniobacteraceae bacterium]|nr:ABC transporter substrate-binding protein [Chthoniobacteraceae bacterium]
MRIPRPNVKRLAIAAAAMLLALPGCRQSPDPSQGRVVVEYWEKWTGFEADAMRAVVDDFNASQNRIYVDYTSTSQIDRKLMLATAGGVPPDLAGIYSSRLPVYAENNALMPLDKMAADAGITRDRYIDIFWQMSMHRGHLWCLPSTPSCTALIWNKKMFRDAGLDPEKPPRTIAELEQDNQKLIKRRPDGSLQSIGYIPEVPGYWDPLWGYFFGGSLWNGRDAITATDPGNVAALQWIASYPKRFGVHDLLTFCDGFGSLASPQNPFFNGRVAMIMDGVWDYNFIKNYAPANFEWGVAPFPSADPVTLKDVTIVEMDGLVIPAGAKHPKEAFDFIQYVNTQKPMEKLCLLQRKFSPLRECSAQFYRDHPNPCIATFVKLAKSPNARPVPPLAMWMQYQNDMMNAVNRVWTGKAQPEQALERVQERDSQAFARTQARWHRLAPLLTAEWSKQP